MQFFKKALISLLLVFAIVVPAFATVNVTWEWVLDDPEVQYFRYQLGGEAADGWTVVPSDVTSFALENVDGSVSYTLYLQQSYDGENWSSSAYAVSTPFIPEVPAEPVATVEPIIVPVVEEPAVVEPEVVEEVAPVEAEEPVVIEPVIDELVIEPEVEEPVVEEPVVEEPVVVEPAVVEEAAPVVAAEPVSIPAPMPVILPQLPKTNDFAMTLDFSVGALYRLDPPVTANLSNMALKANLGFGFENVIRMGNRHGLGLWFDVFALLDEVQKQPTALDYFKLSNYGKEIGFDALLTYNFNLEHFKLIVGAGADIRLSPAYPQGTFNVFKRDINWGYNIIGQLQARWQINDIFSLGLLGNYAYNIKHNVHEVGGTLSMGFSF